MSDFRKYIAGEYSHNELADIANHGCQGGVRGLIYYNETKALYGEFAGDIHSIMGEYCDETGEQWPEYIAKNLFDFQQFTNAAVWFAVEWIAHEATQGEYVSEESEATE
jgi:hypothetical protein